MTSRSYFGKMNSTLGSVVPLAMFLLSTGGPMLLIQKVTCFEKYVGSTFCSGRNLTSFYTVGSLLAPGGSLGFVGFQMATFNMQKLSGRSV